MAVMRVEGKEVTVQFNSRLCIHARRCVTGAPRAFNPDSGRDWIDADATTAEAFMRIATACPSGAITVKRKDGGAPETPPNVNSVMLREDGPLVVHGDLEIAGHGAATRATLCRCGLSKNKPFCDNSHIEGGFKATGEPVSQEMTLGLMELDGPVKVETFANGPMKVTGALEVQAGSGRAVNRVKSAFLCRCGHSANKPYCDGSHKKVGFVAD